MPRSDAESTVIDDRWPSMLQSISLGCAADICTAALRYSAYTVRDQLWRWRPARIGHVPARIEDLTPSWLSAALGPLPLGITIKDVAIDGKTSGTSVRARVRVAYTRDHDSSPPTEFFAKSTPTLTTRVANGVTRTGLAEAGFYQHLRPMLAVRAPVGFHSRFDKRSGRSIHLFEDLTATVGAKFCTPAYVLTEDQAAQVVDQLAILHADAGAFDIYRRPPSWLLTYSQWWRRMSTIAAVKHYNRVALAAADELEVTPPQLRGRADEMWAAFCGSVDAHRQLPPTLLHGDVHMGNWYVTRDGDMGLCDWQCVSIGHGSRDLAYALVSALTVDQRRLWEHSLIKRYLDRLRERGATAPSFERCFDLYRLQVLGALMMWTPTYRPPRFMPAMQPQEISEEMIRRITTAIADLDSLDKAV